MINLLHWLLIMAVSVPGPAVIPFEQSCSWALQQLLLLHRLAESI